MVNENTLFSVMREVCNYFIRRDDIRCFEGDVTINDDFELSFDALSPYIIIRGSKKNDGLYMMETERKIHPIVFEEGDVHPVPETFNGRVWFSYPTQDFLALCNSVDKYQKNIDMTSSPVVSESFGASSRSYGTSRSGGVVTWQENFGTSLRSYRKNMFEEIW